MIAYIVVVTGDFNKASRVVLLKPYLLPNCQLSFRFEVSHSFGNETGKSITRKSCVCTHIYLSFNRHVKGIGCFLIIAQFVNM